MPVYPSPGARPATYQLDTLADNGSVHTQYFDTLRALAQAACRALYDRDWLTRWDVRYRAHRPDHWARAHLRAFSLRGRALDVLRLIQYGAQCYRAHTFGPQPGYTRRQGPVAGIRKSRGGPRYTHCQTMGEMRLNGGWLPEDGEPECRARRRDGYLYHSWDGRPRSTERCWKSQHRGRRSWDKR